MTATGPSWVPPPRIRHLQDLDELIAATGVRPLGDGPIEWEAVVVDWLCRTADLRAARDAIYAELLRD